MMQDNNCPICNLTLICPPDEQNVRLECGLRVHWRCFQERIVGPHSRGLPGWGDPRGGKDETGGTIPRSP